MKYPIGTKLLCNGCEGIVVENFKLPDDVCVSWECSPPTSYDEWWLDENAEVVE